MITLWGSGRTSEGKAGPVRKAGSWEWTKANIPMPYMLRISKLPLDGRGTCRGRCMMIPLMTMDGRLDTLLCHLSLQILITLSRKGKESPCDEDLTSH